MKRYNNKATLALQIVFAVICAAAAIWMLVMVGICLAESGNENFGIALAVYLILAFFFLAGVGVLLIPFILLMVFCKKPWIALAGYLFLVLSIAVFFITIMVLNAQTSQAFLPLVTQDL